MTVSGQSIVTEVEKFAGYPYVYGDTGPSAFDCSGLVQYVLTQLGIKGVPRTSEQQWAWSQHIPKNKLQPGDLVFAQFPGDNASPGHVGVYTGNGRVLSAEDPAQGVGYATLSQWQGSIVGYGRVPGTAASGSPGGGAVSTILSLPSGIISMFDSATTSLRAAMWLFNPENWARIVAGIFGAVLTAFGIAFLIGAAA